MKIEWWRQRRHSVIYAMTGLAVLLRTQIHARVHLIATLSVILAAIWTGVSRNDWLWLIAAISLVWIAEAFNTALEFLADAAVPQQHPLIGHAKDVAAGAVLLAAIAAVAIAGLVFLPHWLQP